MSSKTLTANQASRVIATALHFSVRPDGFFRKQAELKAKQLAKGAVQPSKARFARDLRKYMASLTRKVMREIDPVADLQIQKEVALMCASSGVEAPQVNVDWVAFVLGRPGQKSTAPLTKGEEIALGIVEGHKAAIEKKYHAIPVKRMRAISLAAA